MPSPVKPVYIPRKTLVYRRVFPHSRKTNLLYKIYKFVLKNSPNLYRSRCRARSLILPRGKPLWKPLYNARTLSWIKGENSADRNSVWFTAVTLPSFLLSSPNPLTSSFTEVALPGDWGEAPVYGGWGLDDIALRSFLSLLQKVYILSLFAKYTVNLLYQAALG